MPESKPRNFIIAAYGRANKEFHAKNFMRSNIKRAILFAIFSRDSKRGRLNFLF